MTKLILVTDIFGASDYTKKLASELGDTVEIFDPYSGLPKSFSSEQEAYDCFTQQHGLQQYTDRLHKLIQQQSSPVMLLGFSIGASAIWNISDAFDSSKIKQAILFYGGQIRHQASKQPTIPCHLVFPAFEKHFDLVALIEQLEGQKNVVIEHTQF